jgi:hypothetical protein
VRRRLTLAILLVLAGTALFVVALTTVFYAGHAMAG